MLELSILGFLAEEPLHGYELKERINALTGHVRPVSDGALYPAITPPGRRRQARSAHRGRRGRGSAPGA